MSTSRDWCVRSILYVVGIGYASVDLAAVDAPRPYPNDSSARTYRSPKCKRKPSSSCEAESIVGMDNAKAKRGYYLLLSALAMPQSNQTC